MIFVDYTVGAPKLLLSENLPDFPMEMCTNWYLFVNVTILPKLEFESQTY